MGMPSRMSLFHFVLTGTCLLAISRVAMAADGNDPFLPVPEPAAAPTPAATKIADLVKPVLPTGWTVKAGGDRAIVERSEPVLFHNIVNNPPGGSGNVPIVYEITLTLGERLTEEQFQRRKTANARAVAKAATDLGKNTKDDPEDYAASHPEYGYHRLPWLDTGRNSLYVERTLGGWAQFTSKDVEAECNKVSDAIGDLFHRYEAK
jgi:hypothetical protein